MNSSVLRRIRLAAVGMVVSLAATIFLLSVHFLLAFVGFLVTFALGAVIEASIRQLGQDGIGELFSPITRLSGVHRSEASTGAESSDEG